MGQNCSSSGEIGRCPELEQTQNWVQSHEFFDGVHEDALDVITMITASLSCCGSLFIILTFLRFEQVRTFPYRLVLHLSICDMVANMWYLPLFITKLGNTENRTDDPDAWCLFVGGVTQFFTIAGFVWTIIISYNVYFSLILESDSHMQHMGGYHAAAWSIAAVFTAIPALSPRLSAMANNGTADSLLAGFGYYNNWCWIANDAELLAIVCYDVPLFLTVVLICFFYCHAIRGVRAQNTTVEGLRSKLEIKLHLYIFVFIVSRSFGIVNRVAQLVAPCCPIFGLWVLQEVFTPLQGLGNAIVYGVNYTIRTLYRVRLCDRQRLAASPHSMRHITASSSNRSVRLEQIRTLQRTVSNERSDASEAGRSKMYALVPSPPAYSPSGGRQPRGSSTRRVQEQGYDGSDSDTGADHRPPESKATQGSSKGTTMLDAVAAGPHYNIGGDFDSETEAFFSNDDLDDLDELNSLENMSDMDGNDNAPSSEIQGHLPDDSAGVHEEPQILI